MKILRPHWGFAFILSFVASTDAAPAQREKVQPPLVLYPACPCYHALGEGNGETRVEARINLDPEHRTGLKFAVELADASGKQLQTASADASTAEIVGVSLHVPNQSPATFAIRARLLDADGQELAQEATDVHVIRGAEATVRMGPDGFLRVAG